MGTVIASGYFYAQEADVSCFFHVNLDGYRGMTTKRFVQNYEPRCIISWTADRAAKLPTVRRLRLGHTEQNCSSSFRIREGAEIFRC